MPYGGAAGAVGVAGVVDVVADIGGGSVSEVGTTSFGVATGGREKVAANLLPNSRASSPICSAVFPCRAEWSAHHTSRPTGTRIVHSHQRSEMLLISAIPMTMSSAMPQPSPCRAASARILPFWSGSSAQAMR